MPRFSHLLRRLRERAGHRSPQEFYSSLGGRRFFGCTYRQYSNVENGRSTPGPHFLGKIAAGLGLGRDEAAARDFITAYLEALLAGTELTALLQQVLASRQPAGGGVHAHLRRAIGRSFTARAHHLTRAQSEFVAQSLENSWAFTVLTNDGGRWSPQDLAELTGLDEEGLRRSLRRMAALGLAERQDDGRYRCPLAGRLFLHAREKATVPADSERLRTHMIALSEKRGATLLHQPVYARASESELRGYFPQLIDALRGVDLFSTADKGPDTAFFLIETVVRKVISF